MTSPPHLKLAADNARRRRQVAVPQSAIARAVRVAHEAGPTWRVAIEANVIHLFQGEPPAASAPTHFITSPVRDFRL